MNNTMAPIDDDALNEFEQKAEEVSRLIQGMQDGTVSTSEVDSKIQEEQEQVQNDERDADEKARDTFLARKKLRDNLADKERVSWWFKAEVLVGITRDEALAECNGALGRPCENINNHDNNYNNSNQVDNDGEVKQILDNDGNIIFPRPKLVAADRLDYSVWDKWVPDDPVSLQEMQKVKQANDDKNMAEFETTNADFCKEFVEDQEKRTRTKENKIASALQRKAKGNKLFKQKRYEEAVQEYLEGLKLDLTHVALLTNIAQAHVNLSKPKRNKKKNMNKNLENQTPSVQQTFDKESQQFHQGQALEFCDRALFVDSSATKALWKRAQLLREAGDLRGAVLDVTAAVNVKPDDNDLLSLLETLTDQLEERDAEEAVRRLSDINNATSQTQPMGPPKLPRCQGEIKNMNNKKKKVETKVKSESISTVSDTFSNSVSIIDRLNTKISPLVMVQQAASVICEAHQGARPTDELALRLELALLTLPELLLTQEDNNNRQCHALVRSSNALEILCGWFKSTPASASTSASADTEVDDDSVWMRERIRVAALRILVAACANPTNKKVVLHAGLALTCATTPSHTLAEWTDEHVQMAVLLETLTTSNTQTQTTNQSSCSFAAWPVSCPAHILWGSVGVWMDSFVPSINSSIDALRVLLQIAFNLTAAMTDAALISVASELRKSELCKSIPGLIKVVNGKTVPVDIKANACGCLANLAQHPRLRPSLLDRNIDTLGKKNDSINASIDHDVAGALLLALSASPAQQTTTEYALAALINMSADKGVSPVVQNAVDAFRKRLGSSTVVVCLLELACRGPGTVVRARGASLLSRSTGVGGGVKVLVESVDRMKRVGACLVRAKQAGETESVEQLVRIVAMVLKATAAKDVKSKLCEITVRALKDSGGLDAVLEIICEATNKNPKRSKCNGSIGVGRTGVGSSVIANATQCVVSLLSRETLMGESVVYPLIDKHGIVKALIDLVAKCEDGPERSNAAVGVARLARNERYAQTVRDLRGVEMLVALGNRLVK